VIFLFISERVTTLQRLLIAAELFGIVHKVFLKQKYMIPCWIDAETSSA
jgi:hypothetical protein